MAKVFPHRLSVRVLECQRDLPRRLIDLYAFCQCGRWHCTVKATRAGTEVLGKQYIRHVKGKINGACPGGET